MNRLTAQERSTLILEGDKLQRSNTKAQYDTQLRKWDVSTWPAESVPQR